MISPTKINRGPTLRRSVVSSKSERVSEIALTLIVGSSFVWDGMGDYNGN